MRLFQAGSLQCWNDSARTFWVSPYSAPSCQVRNPCELIPMLGLTLQDQLYQSLFLPPLDGQECCWVAGHWLVALPGACDASFNLFLLARRSALDSAVVRQGAASGPDCCAAWATPGFACRLWLFLVFAAGWSLEVCGLALPFPVTSTASSGSLIQLKGRPFVKRDLTAGATNFNLEIKLVLLVEDPLGAIVVS